MFNAPQSRHISLLLLDKQSILSPLRQGAHTPFPPFHIWLVLSVFPFSYFVAWCFYPLYLLSSTFFLIYSFVARYFVSSTFPFLYLSPLLVSPPLSCYLFLLPLLQCPLKWLLRIVMIHASSCCSNVLPW